MKKTNHTVPFQFCHQGYAALTKQFLNVGGFLFLEELRFMYKTVWAWGMYGGKFDLTDLVYLMVIDFFRFLIFSWIKFGNICLENSLFHPCVQYVGMKLFVVVACN